jgi:RNA polymerase sigma factor (sigma-70 family)
MTPPPDRSVSAELREPIVALLPRLRRFALALTHHGADADDLVQLTVERALVRAAQFRPGTSLASWMFGIMRNAWLDELRVRTRHDRLFAPEEAAATVGVSEQHAERLATQSAMARLPEEQRIAVALVLVEGLAYREAAEVMQVPIGTLTSRLARGRAALQEMLGEDTGVPP